MGSSHSANGTKITASTRQVSTVQRSHGFMRARSVVEA
jgi:hypothetical protein